MENLASLGAFSAYELGILRGMLAGAVNTPVTSSAGRLFDAVASIAGLRQTMRYEGQAAMELEFALTGVETNESYAYEIIEGGSSLVVDWEPMVRRIVDEASRGASAGEISAKFHNALADAIAAVARHVGEERVVLTGGCFQNRNLTERTVRKLGAEGFQPYWHQRVPPNDGGIALGQVVAAIRTQSVE